MNALKLAWTVLFVASLAACGTTKPLSQSEEPATADPYTYVLDGQPTTPETLGQLSAQGTHLSYFVPSGWDGKTMRAFSTEAGLMAAKAQQDQKIQTQGLCVAWQTTTKFYDGVNYTGAKLELGRSTSFMDLASVNINGRNWDNDISSVKGVDCGYSYLYDWVNPNIVISPGMDLSALPYPYNTGPGVSTISAIAVN
jgi:hypothetical protein